MKTFKSNGKLLITGEYVVLDGAVALAIPTKYGQSLHVESVKSQHMDWQSFDHKKNIWFEGKFGLNNFEILTQLQDDDTSERLQQILQAARSLDENFLSSENGFKVETHLDFPKNWGLGTSSTLINNMAQWAHVDAFQLLEHTFGGSGYDIACAQHDTPITYQLNNKAPIVTQVDFNPPFKEHLYFVFLNKKQNSREGIAHYKALKADLTPIIADINAITKAITLCKNLNQFQELIFAHEKIIAATTKQHTVQSLYFNDFDGAIKSLGAWGGDFVLVCSETNPTNYFHEKGFDTVIPYTDMILK
ncbi:GHMP kinase [Hyunsoonleella flava]|uniref:GHMP kinase n=1 Tax=Hyunsoonleella flava TaxID=2527939 RepID=A0A4V6MT43_9FLAO|nr:GYDIA family GHMP kinase [Hyunsoonleella flava]TBN02693.1 GHMP kinase [Hyunsoonleella flava]